MQENTHTATDPSCAPALARLLAAYRSSPVYSRFEYGGELELRLITFGSCNQMVFTWCGSDSRCWVSTLNEPRADGAREAFLWNPGEHWECININCHSAVTHGSDSHRRAAILSAAATMLQVARRLNL